MEIKNHKLKVKSQKLIVNLYISLTTYDLRLIVFCICLSLSPCLSLCQQGISINTNGVPADNSAILDVSSTSHGLLIPRMTTVQRYNIASPATSLFIFNTTTNCFEAYINSSWYSVSCPPPCNIPSSPTAGINIPSQTQIVWNWNKVSGATGYKWSTVNNYTTAKDNGSSVSYTQTGLACNTSYTLFVWANNSCGNSSPTTFSQTTSSCGYICGGDGTFVDARDGQTYGYVIIGTQTWMCQNLNYGTQTLASNTPQQSGYKFCHNNATSFCDNYGGLYEWANLMQQDVSPCNGCDPSCNGKGESQPACNNPVQGLCPAGWHVPSHYEFTLLEKNVGSNPNSFLYNETSQGSYGTDEGSNLKATTFPSGTNSSGFTALPGGDAAQGGFYGYLGQVGYWWSSTESATDHSKAWNRLLSIVINNVLRGTYDKTFGFSVRCVKN
jgi:uncharacterized protein (TIGR02145 family)